MVSSGVVALFVAVAVQAACATPVYSPYPYSGCGCDCACVDPPKVEVGCCPGPVVEKKYVVQKQCTEPYAYSVPTFSKKCYQQPAGVDRKVIPSAFQTSPVCETQQTVVKVPTTDVEVKQQPLCKRTCTTSEYIIQIPIVETTCTNTPLCKKTVKTQDNLFTTTAAKTDCAKQICTQNKIIDTPLTNTVCQDYQGAINKIGAKTVLKPEVRKTCVQLPPYKCLKPATPDYPYTAGVYPGDYAAGAYAGAYAAGAYPGVLSGLSEYPALYPGAAPYAAAELNLAGKYAAAANLDAAATNYALGAGLPSSIVAAEAGAALSNAYAADAAVIAAGGVYPGLAPYYGAAAPSLCGC